MSRSLLHPSRGNWVPIPIWCSFFRELGRTVAGRPTEGARIIAAVTVPTRAYASCFAALGAIDARLNASSEVEPNEHFARLSSLAIGDPVTIVEAGRKYKASFAGHGEVGSRRGIWIERANDGLKQFMPEQTCERVQMGSTGKDRAPKRPDLQRRRESDPFPSAALGLADARSFTYRDDYSSLIVGRIKTLREEMNLQQLAVFDENTGCLLQGTLASLLRPRPFLNEDECYRTDIVADVRADRAAEIGLVPPLVVFDGARGFLRHRSNWRSSSWLVIFDPVESGFQDGVAALNDDFIQRRIDSPDTIPDIDPPAGIELTVFSEVKR